MECKVHRLGTCGGFFLPSPGAVFSLKTPQLFSKFLWDVNKARMGSPNGNLEGYPKPGQAKPSSWVRKRGSATEQLTPSEHWAHTASFPSCFQHGPSRTRACPVQSAGQRRRRRAVQGPRLTGDGQISSSLSSSPQRLLDGRNLRGR